MLELQFANGNGKEALLRPRLCRSGSFVAVFSAAIRLYDLCFEAGGGGCWYIVFLLTRP